MQYFVYGKKWLRFNTYFKKFTLTIIIISANFIGGIAHGASNLSVIGVNADGSESLISNFRWLIEENVTYDITPGTTCQPGMESECLSINFHKSYLPVVAKGTGSILPDLETGKRYFISILPDSGYSISGASFVAGQANVSVYVNAQPIPTAQIRIFVFNDNWPINNEPDTPEETGLGGFNILLEDAGGRYGISGQQITTDAFGNLLGTTYDDNGNVIKLGDGTITTDANGIAVIKNLVPAKYGVQAVAPIVDANGNPVKWVQTTTLEGKKIIDAWVKANEPAFFTEFGPPGPHVFIGFVEEFEDSNILSGGVTITGQGRSIHNARPPEFAFFTGSTVSNCWVGLNDLSSNNGRGVFAGPCNQDSQFSIPNVPDGNYQLVLWDSNQDYIIGSLGVTVENGSCNTNSCNLLDVPIFGWFGRVVQQVFNDTDEDGFWDGGEQPLFEQGTALRWRDGTIYQSFPTDLSGEAPYDEVFPFFSWLVAEVAFDRFKATGVTVVTDDGGPIDSNNPWSFDGVLNPQIQANGLPYRTETGPVLTQGVQTFLGQTNVIQWGKKPYGRDENGGISGLAYYAVTRAENEPFKAAAEVWEPGIPRIQILLYEDNLPLGGDGVIDDLNNDGCPTPSDVDNYPFGNFPGLEDFKYVLDTSTSDPCDFTSALTGNFNPGDAVQITTTDSWDDNLPSDCQGDDFIVNGNVVTDCYDGLRNFNQVRPAVFDGGYAFDSYVPNGISSGGSEVTLPKGIYIVESGQHRVYSTVQEEDRNIDFGDQFLNKRLPAPFLPPPCVGDLHLVPNEFSLFPLFEDDGVTPILPFNAGTSTPMCNRKQVFLTDGNNAAVDFYMFTEVPVAAKVTGFILDDTANEFDISSPTFGEKYSPPYLPVSIRDWTGKEIGRTYSDRWGTFNAVLPSTYTANVASSSGMSPNMITTCMNDPGPIPDGNGFKTDPFYNPQYSQFCYTFQYMPGVTTFLDTPVVPIAAFTGPNQEPLDCSDPDGTPVIWSVTGSLNGPYVSTTRANGSADGSQRITVTAAQDPAGVRNYGFGNARGIISINGTRLTSVNWSNGSISGNVRAGTRSGQLEITRANGTSTLTGITVTVGGGAIQVSPGGSIQDAIDLANPGDLILVPPGEYEELVIMYKPVRLQGSGASTVISAIKAPGEKLTKWRQDVETLFNQGAYSLLPAQEGGFGVLGEPEALFTEEGPGIIVLGLRRLNSTAGGFRRYKSHIDGLSITGADHSGGIVVNGYAENLQIGNNRIFGNHGIYGGGIRIGHPFLARETNNGLVYQDGFNDKINIHHNVVSKNGGAGGAGGGISLYHGADSYKVADNYICGNFTQGDGGGIGHYGLSGRIASVNNIKFGLIENNTIIFNQSFNQGQARNGGGIFIGGAPGLTGDNLTPGAGPVRIRQNLIQGNQAGAGDGGGIATANINGVDIRRSTNPKRWYEVSIINNMVVNNMSALAGGGISLQDTVVSKINSNTIVHNDSTATAGEAFAPGSPNSSTPQPAGIVSRAHSTILNNQIRPFRRPVYGHFSKPKLFNNIIWRNASRFFEIDTAASPPDYGLQNATPLYQGLAVLGTPGKLNPRFSLLTNKAGYHQSNINGANLTPSDLFQFPYVNTDNGETLTEVETKTSIATQPAFDEGGNYIQVRFGPLSPTGDYHLVNGARAINRALKSQLPKFDFDSETRPKGPRGDVGADEHR